MVVTRRLPKAARRETVLAAAAEIFARDGYGSASMRDIAARAGVTVPVVYDHFSSKAELQVALLTEQGEELLRRVAGPFDVTEPRQLLDAVVEAFFSYVESHRLVWRMLFRDAPSDPDVARVHLDLNARASETIARFFEPVVSDHSYRIEGTAFALGEMTKSAVNGLAGWWWDHPDVPRTRVVAIATDMLWGGVVAIAGGPR